MDANTDRPPTAPGRLASIDAYRGAVMFLMMAEVLRLGEVAADAAGERPLAAPGLPPEPRRVGRRGTRSLHDLIQPSFSFLVGVALPFSIASRIAKGQSRGWMAAHAFWRAFVLVALGVFLRSIGQRADELHVRGHALADRPRLRLPLPPRASARRATSGSRWGSSWSDTGRPSRSTPCPRRTSTSRRWASRPTGRTIRGVRRPLGQEQQPGLGVRPLVPEPLPARARNSSRTTADTRRSASSRRSGR